MKKRVTIRDVAAMAGVAPSTVSHVLNGKRPVAEQTREAVMAAIQQLGYRPNPTAQGLVTGDYLMVGVVNNHMGSPYYAMVVRGIQAGLVNTAYHPLIAGQEAPALAPYAAVEVLLKRGVEALIFLDHQIPDAAIQDLSNRYPLITVDRVVRGLETQALLVDDFSGGYKATKYLIDIGHTRIAHVKGASDFPSTLERENGYRKGYEDAGLSIDPDLIVQGGDQETTLNATNKLIAAGIAVTAVFAASDYLALATMLALHHNSLHVPQDVSVVGYDDYDFAAYVVPPLTTVRQPMMDIGVRAARALLKLSMGETLDLSRVPVELIVRESAQPPNVTKASG